MVQKRAETRERLEEREKSRIEIFWELQKAGKST
jgi:hypothetical protein